MLKLIPTSDVHRITSGQVIIDLKSCIKEIIENSIDAKATRLEITVKNYGVTSIEISDNGDGIDDDDFDKICLNHYTSKITTFADVSEVQTFGFRGELMSSLCGILDLSIITTRNEPIATKLKYDHLGNLIHKSRISRSKGTTVIVENLFKNLPVRQKNFIKNCKKEFVKVIQLIQLYCIISDLRVVVHHITNDKKKQILSSNGNQRMLEKITQIYNSQFASTLEKIDLSLESFNINISGYISNCSFGQGRSSGDRQMMFINSRPVLMPKMNKLINEIYKTFNHLEIPSFFLNFDIDTHLLDINITPDKMTVLLSKEFQILELLKEELLEYFNAQNHVIPRNYNSEVEKRQLDLSEFIDLVKLDLEEEESAETKVEDTSNDISKEDISREDSFVQIRESIKRKAAASAIPEEGNNFKRQNLILKMSDQVYTESIDAAAAAADDDDDDDVKSSTDENLKDEESNIPTKLKSKQNLQQHDIYLNVEIDEISPSFPELSPSVEKLDGIELGDLNQSQILINKSQFKDMKIIGQFNLGFIIVSLQVDDKLNLFIVDQHASDEKYNFETLMANTVLTNQKLISPLDLNLNPIDQMIVLDNMKIFNQNGFQINENLQLTSIPMSKNKIFNSQDCEELIHLIKSNPHNPHIRPSKVYRMFASRACRSSVMIGDHLTTLKMSELVSHLSLIDKPWNCPHGRPTMRHLIELNQLSFISDYI